MTSRIARAGFATIFAGLVLAAALLSPVPRASAGTADILREDFESGFLDPRWTVYDGNGASGLDYWGVSNFRAYTGTYSAWGAQVGVQSSGGSAGLNNADPGVQQYDDNMQADLVLDVQASGFTGLTLSFWYFSKTENGGGDWIQAWYEVGGIPTNIFSPRGSTGNAWDFVSLSVPNNVDRVIIRFRTDAANHNFEGAYVDDIILVGTEDVAPLSNVSGIATYTNAIPFAVPYTATDNANASGVAHVELWYRQGTAGAFVLYTTPSNPSGRWTASPIPFDVTLAGGDGLYELYTVAVDLANNTEAAPASADANITIDTMGPALSFVTPTDGVYVGPDSFTAEWQGTDALSGLDRYEISLDGGSFLLMGTGTARTFANVSEGSHTLVLRGYDRAGNLREVRVSFFVGTASPVAAFPWWILAVIAAAVLGILFFLVARRRKEEEKDKRPPTAPPTSHAPSSPSPPPRSESPKGPA